MRNGGASRFAKTVTLVLLVVWALLVLDLTSASPATWLLISLTALLFAIVGRLWRLESEYWLDRLGPITIDFGGSDDE